MNSYYFKLLFWPNNNFNNSYSYMNSNNITLLVWPILMRIIIMNYNNSLAIHNLISYYISDFIYYYFNESSK